MKVALILDSPKRDGRGIALVAYQLIKLGVTVYVIPMYQQGLDIPLIAPDWVVVNYARKNNKALIQCYKNMGIKIAVMDTEGGVLSENGEDSPINWARTFKEDGFSDLIDGYFFWGEKVRSQFLINSGLDESQLILTGSPRYDFCAEPWRKLLFYNRRSYVLVNTNFSAINPLFGSSGETERSVFENLGWDKCYIKNLYDDLRTVFPKYIEVIVNAARQLPHIKFVVRPHPFESPMPYEKEFVDIENVIIDGNGDVLNVIANSLCTMHLNCGTAVETVLLGKVPIAMEFLNTEVMRQHAPLPSTLSTPALDHDDLCDLIANEISRNERQNFVDAMTGITPWFNTIDGQSAKRIARYLFDRKSVTSTRVSVVMAIKGGWIITSFKQFVQGAIAFIFGSKNVAMLRARIQKIRGGKNFSRKDLLAVLDQLSKIEESEANIIVRHAKNPYTRLPLSSLEVLKS